MEETMKKIKAVMIGHAVGDALGVPVEFCERDELTEDPVTDMRGYGTYLVPAGAWSDDTSLSLAALDSLLIGKVDLDAVMANFCDWYYEDAYTPLGETFDVGNTCAVAIENYFIQKMTVDECGLSHERSNGNGSLMRIHPFSLMLYFNKEAGALSDEIIDGASALTHAHERSKLACRIYTQILHFLLDSPSKESVITALNTAKQKYAESPEVAHFARLLDDDFPRLSIDGIKSSGYVVDTLEAAVWCLLTTDSYRDCVLKAVNLGDDTDTVAAIAGGLAGALYGYDAIPKEWLNTLIGRNYIEDLCEKAAGNWMA